MEYILRTPRVLLDPSYDAYGSNRKEKRTKDCHGKVATVIADRFYYTVNE